MNNQSNQNSNLNDYFNGMSNGAFNPNDVNNSNGFQMPQNNQNIMMNQDNSNMFNDNASLNQMSNQVNNNQSFQNNRDVMMSQGNTQNNNMFNDNAFLNQMPNQGQNNGKQQFNPSNNLNMNISSIFKKNKKMIFISLGVVVVLVILSTFLGQKSGKLDNGYTASRGEEIKINELTSKYNIKVVSPMEKYTVTNSDLYGGNYVKLGLSINNLYSDELPVSTINMSLTDSKKKEIYTSQTLVGYGTSDYFGSTSIGSGQTKSGYLYFGFSNDDDAFNTIDLDEIKYLKISVICDANKNDNGTYTFKYSDYYLEL